MSALDGTSMELSDTVFLEISRLVQDISGIQLNDGKFQLVKARLNRRLRELGLQDYRQYVDLVRDNGAGEIPALLDALSTNLTAFFREPQHFDYLAGKVLSVMDASGDGADRLRIWSAGCSSGEEPYSIAITVRETLPTPDLLDARILATDISTRVLATAGRGLYEASRIEPVPPLVRARSFTCVETKPKRIHAVRPEIRRLVHFARLNLMGRWPMKGPFDAIFCRNVMIYFDRPTKARLVQRYWDLLRSGGTLFVGHSESLAGIPHRFRYVQPTVYEKP